jgi:hypothetical protein
MKTLCWLLCVFISLRACAQSSARFAITRSVIAGGGATSSSSARFQLDSTIAQPLAAVPASARFSIQGGFWIVPPPVLFAPGKVGTNFVVSIQSELDRSYTVQYENTLGSGWSNLVTVAGTGGIITVTNAALGKPQRYFRLVQQ